MAALTLNRKCFTTKQPWKASAAPPCLEESPVAHPGRSQLYKLRLHRTPSPLVGGLHVDLLCSLRVADGSLTARAAGAATLLATPELRLRLRDHPSLMCLQALILHITCLASRSHCDRDDHELQNWLQASSLNCGHETACVGIVR